MSGPPHSLDLNQSCSVVVHVTDTKLHRCANIGTYHVYFRICPLRSTVGGVLGFLCLEELHKLHLFWILEEQQRDCGNFIPFIVFFVFLHVPCELVQRDGHGS